MQILDLPTNSLACRACEFHLTDSGGTLFHIRSNSTDTTGKQACRLCLPILFFLIIFHSFSGIAISGKSPLYIPQKNLLLIGWDAVQWNHLHELLADGRLPHIKRFSTLVRTEITDHATSTKPGWTQIVTGLSAKKSGVLSNERFRPFPQRSCLFDILERVSDGQVMTAFLAGKDHNLGSLGPGVKWIDAQGKPTSIRDGEPWYYARRSFDLWWGDADRCHREVGALALDLLDRYGKHNRFAFFIHFADPDQKGHKFGENSRNTHRLLLTVMRNWDSSRTNLRNLGFPRKPLLWL